MSLVTKCNKMAKAILKSLPEDLSFHNTDHTQYVVEGVQIIGEKSYDLSKEEIEILKIAAWYHDTGFIKKRNGHEFVSKKFARNFLKVNGYSDDKIKQVCCCIEATRLDKNPESKLEKVISDADLRHLSDQKYPLFAEKLRIELEATSGLKISKEEWIRENIYFLKNHRYYTPYGRQVLEKRKQDNIEKLKRMLPQFL